MLATTDERMLLTVEETAKTLGIGRTLAWKLVQQGDLPSIRLGRLVRVPQRELEDWIHEHSSHRAEETI